MRTTLTLQDDLARELKQRVRATGHSFKQVVNEAIRRGLGLGPLPDSGQARFRVEPRACGFRTGIDPLKLNQIYDELEIDDVLATDDLQVHEP